MSSSPTPHSLAVSLGALLDGRWRSVREQARRDLDPETYGPPDGPVSMEDYRTRITGLLHELTRQPFAAIAEAMGVETRPVIDPAPRRLQRIDAAEAVRRGRKDRESFRRPPP